MFVGGALCSSMVCQQQHETLRQAGKPQVLELQHEPVLVGGGGAREVVRWAQLSRGRQGPLGGSEGPRSLRWQGALVTMPESQKLSNTASESGAILYLSECLV